VWGSELNMALYYVLLRLWMHIGHGEFLVRMLGVLFATATVPVIYFLGRRLFDDRIAILAALLLAVHPYHLVLAQRARSYPLLILLVSLSTLYFVRAVQEPAWTSWMAYAGFSAAAVYSHFFAVLVIGAQLLSLLYLLGRPLPWKMVLTALGVLAVLLVPFAAFVLLHGDKSHIAWVVDPSRQQVLSVLYSLTLSKARCLTYIVAWCFAALAAWRTSSLDRRWPYQFTFTWLIVPPSVVAAASLFRPLLVDRYLSICIPAAVLLAAAGVVQITHRSRMVGFGLLAFIVLYSTTSIRFYLRHPEFGEDVRGASRYVLAHVQPGDAVIVGEVTGMTFDYYREIDGEAVPQLARLESVTTPLPSPLPENVWFFGSTRPNPNWRGAAPDAAAEMQTFAVAHARDYCPLPPHTEAGGVTVWQFRRCASLPEPGR